MGAGSGLRIGMSTDRIRDEFLKIQTRTRLPNLKPESESESESDGFLKSISKSEPDQKFKT